MSTSACVCGAADRKSASIDSLTASSHCASSMMYTAGFGPVSKAALSNVVKPAPARIRVDVPVRVPASPRPSRSSSSSRSSTLASGSIFRVLATASARFNPRRRRSRAAGRPRRGRESGWNAIHKRCDMTSIPRLCAIAAASRSDPALTDSRRSLDTDDCGPCPLTTSSRSRLTAVISWCRPTRVVVGAAPTQVPSSTASSRRAVTGSLCAFDPHRLRIAQPRNVLHQARSGFAEHHPARAERPTPSVGPSRPVRRSPCT